MTANICFRDVLDEEMQDPEFRAAMEELEPAYQVARLRIKRGLTQKELAKKVGTRQSSISRLESGKRQPSVRFLRRIAKALQARLNVEFVPEEEHVLVQKDDAVQDTMFGAQVLGWVTFPMPDGSEYLVAAEEEPRQVRRSSWSAQKHGMIGYKPFRALDFGQIVELIGERSMHSSPESAMFVWDDAVEKAGIKQERLTRV